MPIASHVYTDISTFKKKNRDHNSSIKGTVLRDTISFGNWIIRTVPVLRLMDSGYLLS